MAPKWRRQSRAARLGKRPSNISIASRGISEAGSYESSSDSLLYAKRSSIVSDTHEPHESVFVLGDFLLPGYTIHDLDATSSEETSSECLSTEAAIINLQQDLEELPDFFLTLGTAPSVDSISISGSLLLELEAIKNRVSGTGSAAGQFVDPLTGESLSSDSIRLRYASEAQIRGEGKDEQLEEEEEEQLVNLSLTLPEIIEEKVIPKRDDEEDLEIFFELPEPPRVSVGYDFEKIAQAERARLVRRDVFDIIFKVIRFAVKKAETINRKELLRESLDKVKLIQPLKDGLVELSVQRSINNFLSFKGGQHFRRKGVKRFIYHGTNVKLEGEKIKLKKMLRNLNMVMCTKRDISAAIKTKKDILQANIDDLQAQVNAATEEMETTIKSALTTGRSEKLKQFVESNFAYFAIMRKQIGKLRCELILAQHTYASLNKKAIELNDFGNGLHMDDFDRLHAEVQTLNKKLEESNIELKKQNYHFHCSLHALAHYREKYLATSKIVQDEMVVYNACVKKSQELKKSINDLKLERIALTKEISAIGYEGGIIDKPKLMKDYDECMEHVIQKQASNQQLRKKTKELEKAIELMEKEYLSGK